MRVALAYWPSATAANAQRLTVAAASDLQAALPAIAAQFEKETGARVTLTFGSSGNFFAQIQNGAPFDVFFSADIDYPRQLEQAGLAERGTPVRVRDRAASCCGRGTTRASTSGAASRCSSMPAFAGSPSPTRSMRRTAARPWRRCGTKASTIASQPKLVLGENISQAAQFVAVGQRRRRHPRAVARARRRRSSASAPTSRFRRRSIRRSSRPPSSSQSSTQKALARAVPRVPEAARGAATCCSRSASPPPRATARYGHAQTAAMDWTAIALSSELAAIVSRHPARHRPADRLLADVLAWRWKFLVESIVALPLVLPPTVLGFYVLVAHRLAKPDRPRLDGVDRSRRWRSRSRRWSSRRFSTACRSRVQPIAAAFAQIDRTLLEASVDARRRPRSARSARIVAAALARRHHRRRRPELRAHDRRVRRRPDGRRQPAGHHAHGVDLDLRRRAGLEFRGGASDRARAARCSRSRSLAAVYALLRKPWAVAPLA